MRSITLISSLAFIAQVDANAQAVKDSDSQADNLIDALADRLVERVHNALSFQKESMDVTTLGKPGYLEGPADARVPISNFVPSSTDKQEVIIIEEPPDDGDALAYVLGLRGGAKRVPAMKATIGNSRGKVVGKKKTSTKAKSKN